MMFKIVFLAIYLIEPGCRNGIFKFELITGYAYTTSSDLMQLIPGSLELTQCLTYCELNITCKAINYETGLCVLLSTSALLRPDALKPAQFPVFTIYAQKVCLSRLSVSKCTHAWTHERVIGYKLKSTARKNMHLSTREKCIESCLREVDFDCRSANYNKKTSECSLYDHDRHSFNPLLLDDLEMGFQVDPNYDYLESNCIQDQNRVCEFKKINGLILKTVDSMYPNVQSVDECKKKCLESPYRCHSFDFGDGTTINNICRTSHLSRSSSLHIQDPYQEVSKGATYELDNCYNVSLFCGAKEMRVQIKMNRPFTGKIYAISKPNSCYNTIKGEQEFDISMPYNDINCGIMQSTTGRYSNNIVIQHHELIVTSSDVGLSINCQYDLSNKKITHNIQMQDMGDNFNEYITDEHMNRPPIQEATVTLPTVRMRITDREGNDIRSAEVGDLLSLRFEIPDNTSPYEIFVREVIVDDGVDSSEFLLIDERGCPTDTSIMGGVKRVIGSRKSVEAPFEAFKFPTSGIVQFRALVVPCLPSCEPVSCLSTGLDGVRKKINSLGRRRRRSLININNNSNNSNNINNNNSNNSNIINNNKEKLNNYNSTENELIVIQAIEILDKFPAKRSAKPLKHVNLNERLENETCVDINSLVTLCFIFLSIQMVIISSWGYIKYRSYKFDKLTDKFKTAERPTNRSFLSLDDLNILV